jgi:hypothetical protein
MTTPQEAFDEAEIVMISVKPSRLAWGRYDHERNRGIGEGDIHASYSADTIATSGKIRKAFRFQGRLMVTVSLSGRGGVEQAEAYNVIPMKAFTGTPTTYHEKTGEADAAEAARNDPQGFYHGMKVTCGREAYILSGPPVVFVATRPDEQASIEPEQLDLF